VLTPHNYHRWLKASGEQGAYVHTLTVEEVTHDAQQEFIRRTEDWNVSGTH
jgi:hypothetical protein